MGISYHRRSQLRDYRSDARSLVSASYRWMLQYWHRGTRPVAHFYGRMQASTSFRFFMELVTFAGVAFTVISFWNEGSDRTHNRAHQAWTLVAAHERGNIGLQNALEFLHGTKQYELSSLKLDKAQLHSVALPGANLNHSNFEEAEMSESDLAGAKLGDAKFYKAKLYRANLSGAVLGHADLRNARLVQADLSSAVLEKADLSNADLRDADLRQSNLAGANLYRSVLTDAKFENAILVGATLQAARIDGDWSEREAIFCRTIMPDGSLNNRDCPEELEKDCLERKDALEDYMKPACNWLSAGNVKPDDYADALIR